MYFTPNFPARPLQNIEPQELFSVERISLLVREQHLSIDQVLDRLLEDGRNYTLSLSPDAARQWLNHARKWIQASYQNVQSGQLYNESDLCRLLDGLIEQANRMPLPTHRGTLKRCLLAHLMACREQGSLSHHRGDRGLSLLAKVSRPTVAKRNRDLEQLRVIERLSQTFKAQVWTLNIERLKEFLSFVYHQPNTWVTNEKKFSPVGWDCFRPGGLSNSCGETLQALWHSGPLDAKQIEKQTGLSQPTVYRALDRLLETGIVVKSGKVFCLRSGFDLKMLETIARELPTYKRTARLREQYSRERKRYAEHRGTTLDTEGQHERIWKTGKQNIKSPDFEFRYALAH